MKALLKLSALFFAVAAVVACQKDPSDVETPPLSTISTRAGTGLIYTPNGTPVTSVGVGYPVELHNDAQKLTEWLVAKSRFPSIEFVSGATTTYNCHGYAWHMSEGGETVRIGAMPMEYIDDDSYYEIASAYPGAKVRYLSDQHSAVVAHGSDPDMFISKWGDGGPLVRHNKDVGYYDASQIKYYVKSSLLDNIVPEGADVVQTGIPKIYGFSLPDALKPADQRTRFSWIITKNGNFYSQRGSNYNTYLETAFSEAGVYTIRLKITLPNSGMEKYSTTKTVLVAGITGPDTATKDTVVSYGTLPVNLPVGFSFTGWTVTGGSYTTTSGLNSRNLNIKFTSASQYTLKAWFMAGGTSYSVDKVVNVTAPAAPFSAVIYGTDAATVNIATSYYIATYNLPTGTTFNGWTVWGGSYTTTSGLTDRNNLNIKFTSESQFSLVASFTLPGGDVYYVAPKTVYATVPLGLAIDGPETFFFEPDIEQVYRITPTPLPPGVTFNGWSITSETSPATIYEPNGLVTKVIFTGPWTHVLTASFTMPDGSIYPVVKIIGARL